MYGLLLFNNYNQKGNSSKLGHVGDDITINFEKNRVKSVLVSKEKLLLDPREENSKFLFLINEEQFHRLFQDYFNEERFVRYHKTLMMI